VDSRKTAKKQPPPQLAKHCFTPGESGNPSGRPKGSVGITARIRAMLEKDGGKLAEAIATVFLRESAKGKFPFAKEIIDRIDGKISEKIETDGQLKIIVEHVKPNASEADSDT